MGVTKKKHSDYRDYSYQPGQYDREHRHHHHTRGLFVRTPGQAAFLGLIYNIHRPSTQQSKPGQAAGVAFVFCLFGFGWAIATICAVDSGSNLPTGWKIIIGFAIVVLGIIGTVAFANDQPLLQGTLNTDGQEEES